MSYNYVVFFNLLIIKVTFQVNELFAIFDNNSFVVKLKKNVLTETHKNSLLSLTFHEQFNGKMDLPLVKVSKLSRVARVILQGQGHKKLTSNRSARLLENVLSVN